MMQWIDIVSPRLRSVHQEWIKRRSASLMPDLRIYNDFASQPPAHLAHDVAVTALVPAAEMPIVRHVGQKLASMLSSCRNGISFADLVTPTEQTAIVMPVQRACRTRQPECRRMASRTPGEKGIEMLVLPFGDGGVHVRVVHVIFDHPTLPWRGQLS